ncbi:hypothetical protein GCK32_000216 [Trichostrongylus colubriformis]|uniref:Mannosyl-oligosaccharide glucosidase n=1 Tax=Trichostrongylus colubriformis TaxID=6319 RepID=A0AAN8IF10_TRICO
MAGKQGMKQKGGPTGRQKQNKKKEGLSWSMLVLISALIATVSYFTYTEIINPPRHLRKMLPAISGLSIDRKKWGSYRSHTYFGLRTKDPRSPLFGVIWYEQPNVLQRPHMRHWCDQGDGLKGYGWYAADGRTFGRENVTDRTARLNFDWINHAETWTARVRIEPKARYTIVFYLTAEDSLSKFRLGNHLRDPITGRTQLFGDIKLMINVKNESEVLHSTLVWDDDIHLDHLNELILMNTGALESDSGLVYQLGQQKPFHEGRFVAVQLNIETKTEIEIAFNTRNYHAKTGSQFAKELAKREQDFERRFLQSFELEGKDFSEIELGMAKVALSNMLGGIGYWHGYNKVHLGGDTVIPYGPHELFSAVPSRSFFPRGFLWDEGFHNMLIRKYDPDLSVEILVSWLNTMSEDGWIPREMILGVEAEAKVPAEFVLQRTNVANPPSIFYVFDQILNDEKMLKKYNKVFAGVYPRLEAWYRWLRRSQAGKKKGTFRWRGRNSTTVEELNPKTLASGLDDYPRASHPSEEEYHLDLRCWMALCSRVMDRLAHIFEDDKHKNKYAEHAKVLGDYKELVHLHWSEDKKAFFDYGRHSDKVLLVRKSIPGAPEQYVFERSVAREPKLGFVDDVFGYNSLYPLMLRLLPPESDALVHTLASIVDPELIWTNYGLRSISQRSPYYAARNTEHDPPYWRGYIWINVNYMVLSALKYYGSIPGPSQTTAQHTFHRLKKNLVTNMAKEFNRTGYIWEHYDDKTGQGRGSHPFNVPKASFFFSSSSSFYQFLVGYLLLSVSLAAFVADLLCSACFLTQLCLLLYPSPISLQLQCCIGSPPVMSSYDVIGSDDDEPLITNTRSSSGVLSPSSVPSRLRQPYLFTGGLGLSREGSLASLHSDDDFRDHNMALRYRLYSRIDPGGQQLRMPDHVIPSEYFSILPFEEMKDRSGKQNSLVTIFSIWNTMMGTSLLAMPWALQQAGVFFGIFLMLSIALLCFYTAFLVVDSPRGITGGMDPIVMEFSDVCRHFLGKGGEYLAVVFSVIVLLGGIMVYWVLMSNFLYYTGTVVYESLQPNSSTIPIMENKTFTCDVYCPTEMASPLSYLERGSNEFLEQWSQPSWNFDSLWQLQERYRDSNSIHYATAFSWRFPALTGTLTLSYFIHNAVLTILRNQKNPENNARDLSIGYLLAALCYVFIGFTFYAGFPVQRTCISDNFLNNFGAGDILSSTARLFLLFQMVTVLPLLMFLIRSQLFYAFTGNTWPGFVPVFLLNCGIITIAVAVAVLYPRVGSILRYVGSLSGLIYVFALPCLVYMRKLHMEGGLTPTKRFIHTTIIAIGVLNFIAQFVI